MLFCFAAGGSSGLGRECARTLAKRGAHVVLAARRVDVLQDVKSLIIAETPTARVECMPLNLTNLKSVRQFAEEYKQKKMPLNILINNGGTFAKEFTPTDDGIEVMWATHVLGHYALTMLLMDKLKETAAQSGIEGRIMFTGSDAHRISYEGGINFEALTNPNLYNAYQAYGQSKTGDILLARMIGQQLKREGVNVVANSGHPGAVKTPLGQNFFEKGTTQVGYNVSKPFIKNAEQGAANLVYVAASPEIKGVSGKYFSDFKEIKPSLSAQNDELGQKVIDYCEDFMAAKLPR
ncbi:hypothetical protein KC19_10G156800 [Ceratodon purpureus]|uniref:Uncharacterized protein n=1 Tax=Ceratodon purpureus TaxID=3225 RepID=A0A8T0GPD9_CERPU|nr:hypothetical protein KC19_10G156800 [Ceratodon purpureus]